MSDPRLGLPSASALERLFACPGSYLLSKQVPAKELISTKDGERGTRIHEARAEGDVSELDLPEADLVQQMADEEKRIYDQWCDDHSVTDAEIRQEERVWLYRNEKRTFSAQIDIYALSPSKRIALVMDRKSGRRGVAPPVCNWQLKSSLVVLSANHALVGGRVAIVQPLARRQSPCEYDADHIYGKDGAWDQLNDLLREIEKPDAKLQTGDHCTYCPAKHICPAARQVVTGIAALKGFQWSLLTPAQKIALWEQSKLAVKIAEHIQANVKAEINADPNAIPGLVKSKDQHPRVITDAIKAYGHLAQAFPELQPEDLSKQFNALIEFSVGALEGFYREKRGGTKQDATQWVNNTFADCLTTKTKSGSITRAKE